MPYHVDFTRLTHSGLTAWQEECSTLDDAIENAEQTVEDRDADEAYIVETYERFTRADGWER